MDGLLMDYCAPDSRYHYDCVRLSYFCFFIVEGDRRLGVGYPINVHLMCSPPINYEGIQLEFVVSVTSIRVAAICPKLSTLI